jgi:hypothetical protein
MTRGKGEGSIFPAKDQTGYVGMLDLGEIDGKRVRRKVRGRTRTEVANKLRALRADVNRTRGNGEIRTVGELLDRWICTAAAARLGESSSSFVNYKAQVDQHLKPALGGVRLDRIHAEQIDDYCWRRRATATAAPPSCDTGRSSVKRSDGE